MTIDEVDDKIAAKAFRRLVHHLQHRADVQNIDLMGSTGFCRNCLSDWIAEASGGALDTDAAREAIHGMDYADWKASQPKATAEQLARMEASVALNRR